MRRWAKEELTKEGIEIDRQKLREPKCPRSFLPKRWIVERTFFSWLRQNRGGSKQRLRASAGERRSVHLRGAMSRLMARRLARS